MSEDLANEKKEHRKTQEALRRVLRMGTLKRDSEEVAEAEGRVVDLDIRWAREAAAERAAGR